MDGHIRSHNSMPGVEAAAEPIDSGTSAKDRTHKPLQAQDVPAALKFSITPPTTLLRSESESSALPFPGDSATNIPGDYIGYFHLAQEADGTLKEFGLFLKRRALRQCKQRKESPGTKPNLVTVSVGGGYMSVSGHRLSTEPGQYSWSSRTLCDRVLLRAHHSQITFSVMVRQSNIVVLVTRDGTLKVNTTRGDKPLLTAHVLSCLCSADASALSKAVKGMIIANVNKRCEASRSDSVSNTVSFREIGDSTFGHDELSLSLSRVSIASESDRLSTSSNESDDTSLLCDSRFKSTSYNSEVSQGPARSRRAREEVSTDWLSMRAEADSGISTDIPPASSLQRKRAIRRPSGGRGSSTPMLDGSLEPYQADTSLLKGLKTTDYVMGTPAALLGLSDRDHQPASLTGLDLPMHAGSIPGLQRTPSNAAAAHVERSDSLLSRDQYRSSGGYAMP